MFNSRVSIRDFIDRIDFDLDCSGQYFDMHQRPIVHLIHQIQLATLGKKTARNELRLKYHYHTCVFPLPPDVFLQMYNFLYSRTFGLTRYTIILGKKELLSRLLICLRHSGGKHSSVGHDDLQ